LRWIRRADAKFCAPLPDDALSRKTKSIEIGVALKAPDSKMKNILSQISSLIIRFDFIGDSHYSLHQAFAEVR
jgi:hypothetical protein